MMSASIAAGVMDSVHYDETSCGPLCQHPLCWASNRRVDRGLPRVVPSLSTHDDDDEATLPTMKVFNLLDEYGESNKDRYPSKNKGKDAKMPSHIRSASAPNIMAAYHRSHAAPFTPFTSPLGIKGGSVRSTRSAKNTTRSRSRTTPKISRVEVKEMLGDLPPPSAESSSFYIWCPSKKMYKKGMQGKEEVPQSASKEPVKIQPKDVTDEMVPNVVEKKRQTKQQKNKRTVHDTPTGGRPYTHPTRSPPPVARRTLPQDIDDGILQLLSLPRDVLLEVLDHIKKSDLLDKSKVQLLISRLMPLIHFAPDSPQSPRESTNTPLLVSGILQNHKVTLHNMEQKLYDKHEFPQTQGSALFLDDAVVSQMASSVVFDEMQEQIEEQENIPESRREEMELPMRSAGRMAKAKPLAPIRGTQREPEPVYRLASVSAKTLPPLKPGVTPVKPFNYTNNASTLDLTLVPLPPPKAVTPERIATQTPFSAIASTLHVTIPSVPSPDRTVCTTPVVPYANSPVPLLAKTKSARSSPSPLPSEDFRRHHLYAMSPSMSTKVPKTPLGTPATALRQHLYTRESLPSKVLSDHVEQSVETSSSPTPHPPMRTGTEPSEPPLGTIRETAASTYPPDDSITAGFNSRSDYATTPSKQLLSSMSPYGFASLAGQNSEKDPVPITPAPTSATEDSWPNIDERDFMHSPDRGQDPILTGQQPEHPAPVAPPPSPEPRDPNADFEFQMPDGNKSAPLSLTPLAEEEEELDEEDDGVKPQEVLPGDYTEKGDGTGVVKPASEEEDARNNETSGVIIEGNGREANEDDKQDGITKDPEQEGAGTSSDANQIQSVAAGAVKSDTLHDEAAQNDDDVTSKKEAAQSDIVTSKKEAAQSDDVTSQKETAQSDDVISKTETAQSDDVTSKETAQSDDVASKKASLQSNVTSKEEISHIDEVASNSDTAQSNNIAVKKDATKSDNVIDSKNANSSSNNETNADNPHSNLINDTTHVSPLIEGVIDTDDTIDQNITNSEDVQDIPISHDRIQVPEIDHVDGISVANIVEDSSKLIDEVQT
ncbi:uncharacterized protein [Amphiura filiformis]|uniref:uncharacterized protein isoform X2 n=1 Tax=Amphiura filiformis TaxID=82378 RepID=UPI003B21E71E